MDVGHTRLLNPSAALLSNYEVLDLLKQLEADHIARTRTAQRLKKEEDDPAAAIGNSPLTVSENLRTIEVEVSPPPPFTNLPNPSFVRLSNTSPQTFNPPVPKLPRASNASRRTSHLSA